MPNQAILYRGAIKLEVLARRLGRKMGRHRDGLVEAIRESDRTGSLHCRDRIVLLGERDPGEITLAPADPCPTDLQVVGCDEDVEGLGQIHLGLQGQPGAAGRDVLHRAGDHRFGSQQDLRRMVGTKAPGVPAVVGVGDRDHGSDLGQMANEALH